MISHKSEKKLIIKRAFAQIPPENIKNLKPSRAKTNDKQVHPT